MYAVLQMGIRFRCNSVNLSWRYFQAGVGDGGVQVHGCEFRLRRDGGSVLRTILYERSRVLGHFELR